MSDIAAAFGQIPANLRGILLMLLSALMYAFMIVIVRLVSADIHPAEIVFFRLFGGLVVMLPAFWAGGLKSMKTTHYGRYTYRAALQGGAMVCYYAGLAILPLAAGPMSIADAVRTAADCGIREPDAVLRYVQKVADPGAKAATVDRYIRTVRRAAP